MFYLIGREYWNLCPFFTPWQAPGTQKKKPRFDQSELSSAANCAVETKLTVYQRFFESSLAIYLREIALHHMRI